MMTPMRNIVFIFTALILVANIAAREPEKVDFFIAENPAQFEILNRYQQKISAQDKLLFRPFTPWQIIEKKTLLSDQFSGAMEVEFDGRTYFFVWDEKSGFIKKSTIGLFYFVSGVEIKPEKLQVIQNKAVLFSRVPFWKKNAKFKRSYLEKGLVLHAILKKGKDYFVQRQDAKKAYGWVRPSGRLSLKIIGRAQPRENDSTQLNPALLTALTKKINTINQVYKKLFHKLNSEKNQNKPAPYWSLESNATGIVLELQNNQSGKFKKSISYFVNEVEALFSGNEYEIYSSGSAIEILRK
jgi:hypothetical protein